VRLCMCTHAVCVCSGVWQCADLWRTVFAACECFRAGVWVYVPTCHSGAAAVCVCTRVCVCVCIACVRGTASVCIAFACCMSTVYVTTGGAQLCQLHCVVALSCTVTPVGRRV